VANTERDDPMYGPIALRYTRMMVLMTVWTAASIFASPTGRLWMWAAFVAQFVIGMVIMGLRPEPDPTAGEAMGAESLLERFGLFVIIVLGEVVAGVVNGIGSVNDLTATVFLTGFAGLAVAIALWWTYFDLLAMRPVRRALRPRILSNIGQLPLAMAIAGVGGATVSLIEHTGHEDGAAIWTFSGFLCLAMVAIGFLAWQLRDRAELAEMLRPAAIFSAPVVALALLLPLTHPSGLLLAGLLVVAMAVQWVFTFRGWWRTPEGQAKLQTVLAIDHTDSAA
jgi:low temperature requirement protein LtrA